MSMIPSAGRSMVEPVHITDQRHAQALSEVQKMRTDYTNMHMQLADAEREIVRLTNLAGLLEKDKEHYRCNAEVAERKLVRLATSIDAVGKMSDTIGELTAVARSIVKDSKEFEEVLDESEGRTVESESEIDIAGKELVSALRGATLR